MIAAVERSDVDARSLALALEEHGVRAMPLDDRRLRFVTHRDVGPPDLSKLETPWRLSWAPPTPARPGQTRTNPPETPPGSMGIFKAYDIRGIVPDELNPELAKKIGNAFARLLGAKRLVVGRDMRVHSPEICEAVTEGMRDAGCTVILPGLTSTPMTYYAIGTLDCDGGLCVTASHNPGEYNGMKLCGRGATPISAANGSSTSSACARSRIPSPCPSAAGSRRSTCSPTTPTTSRASPDVQAPIKVAIDAANGMAGHTLGAILERLPNVEAVTMLMDPDGSFPVHEANPLKEEILEYVGELVRESGADLGVSFDGDADRCCFVDESGRPVSADLITALLAPTFADAPRRRRSSTTCARRGW